MSAFSSLSEFWQTMLPFIMLVEIVLEIGLFMYQLLRSNKPVRSLLSLAVMVVMIREKSASMTRWKKTSIFRLH